MTTQNHAYFQMSASRDILNEIADPPALFELIEQIELAVNDGSSRTFDIAKSLIESACKTIMIDRGVDVEHWDTPKLLKNTLLRLKLLPSGHSEYSSIHEGLTKTARGLFQSVQGLCELRNLEGIISHGPDGYKEPLEPAQILLAARSADTIVHFLLKAHWSYPVDYGIGRLVYEDQEEFNEFVDDTHEIVSILGLDFLPSEILFYMDKDQVTYREKLIEFQHVPETK